MKESVNNIGDAATVCSGVKFFSFFAKHRSADFSCLKVILFICSLFTASVSTAQDQAADPLAVNVIPPSPNAAALGKYGEVPVSLYTGIPQINIPLYTVTSGDISLPISLSYHASGIRASDEGSWVGLGWSLNAGGVITRTIRGLPDNGNGMANPEVYKLAEQYYNGELNEGTFDSDQYLVDIGQGLIDSEPDQYYINCPALTAKFVTDKNGQTMFMPHSTAKLSGNIDFAFTLVGNSGNIFNFTAGEKTSTSGCSSSALVNSARYLTKMTSSNGLNQINLEYKDEAISYAGSVIQTEYFGLQQYNFGTVDSPEICSSYHTAVSKSLLSIEGEEVIINFFAENDKVPGDQGKGKRLDRIEVVRKSDQKLIRSFILSYIYQGDRMFLSEVRETGTENLNKPPHKFEYNLSEMAPGFDTKAVDHWGYFNSNTAGTLVPDRVVYDANGSPSLVFNGAYRETDSEKIKLLSLNKIVYPTGGYTIFEFENNRYGFQQGTEVNTEKVEHINTTFAVSGDKLLDPEGNPIGDAGLEKRQRDIFINGANQYIKLLIKGNNNLNADNEDYYLKIFDKVTANIIYSGYVALESGKDQFSSQEIVFLPQGEYTIEAFSDIEGKFLAVNLIYDKKGEVVKYGEAGGLRIKGIKTYESDGVMASEKRYSYNMPEESDRSSGTILSKPRYYHGLEAVSYNSLLQPIQYSFEALTSSSNTHLGQTQGGIVGYNYVKEEVSAGETGYTVHRFLNSSSGDDCIRNAFSVNFPDYAHLSNPSPSERFPFPPPNYRDHLNGTLLSSHSYDVEGNMVQSIENQYGTVCSSFVPVIGLKVGVSIINDIGITIVPASNVYTVGAYFFEPGKNVLTQTTQTLYDQNDPSKFIQTVTNYEYGNTDKHLFPTKTTTVNSTGETIEQETVYAADLVPGETLNEPIGSMTAALKTMSDKHILSPVIEQRVKKNGEVLSAQLTEYENIEVENTPVHPMPRKIWISEKKTPDKNFKQARLNKKGEFLFDNNYIERAQFIAYDEKYNLTEHARTNAPKTAYIWGHDKTLPIAEVINAAADQVFYTSFEENGDEIFDAATGGRSLCIDGGTYTSDVSLPAGDYVLTYRYKTSETGEWDYGDVQFGGGVISLSGMVKLDEVRVHPADALMKTYTYYPLIGVRTETDANNNTMYYEYDSLGRLTVVRDKDKNILRTTEYHYASQGE